MDCDVEGVCAVSHPGRKLSLSLRGLTYSTLNPQRHRMSPGHSQTENDSA